MLVIPYSNMKRSAECLEIIDLREAIRSCRDKILEGEFLEVIAKYGMVLSNDYKTRTGKETVKQTFWLNHFSGDPQWPETLLHWQHRSFLVLLGYSRALMAQGYEPEKVTEIVSNTKTAVELESKLKALLKNSYRQYSRFTELPGAWPLSL